jgi:hypothetical protein
LDRRHVHQLVSGGDDGNARQLRDRELGVAAGRGHRDFATGDAGADADEFVSSRKIRSPPVDAPPGREGNTFGQADTIPRSPRFFVGHDTIGSERQYRTRRDFDARRRIGQRMRGRTCRLKAGNVEFAPAGSYLSGRKGKPVHRDAIERRQVAIRDDRSAQNSSASGVQGANLRRELPHVGEHDCLSFIGSRQHA